MPENRIAKFYEVVIPKNRCLLFVDNSIRKGEIY